MVTWFYRLTFCWCWTSRLCSISSSSLLCSIILVKSIFIALRNASIRPIDTALSCSIWDDLHIFSKCPMLLKKLQNSVDGYIIVRVWYVEIISVWCVFHGVLDLDISKSIQYKKNGQEPHVFYQLFPLFKHFIWQCLKTLVYFI